ncbi:MAG: hypothetical protein ACFFDR_00370 [Candidatus Thorarchaeota archaeon]
MDPPRIASICAPLREEETVSERNSITASIATWGIKVVLAESKYTKLGFFVRTGK